MTRKDIAENLSRIADGIKYTAVSIKSIQTSEEKKLFVLRLQNDARELNQLAEGISHQLIGGGEEKW